MKEILFLNPENVLKEQVNTYRVREAARAVVIDENGDIALLHASKNGYYKLPGGGLDEDTNKIVALKRECREELGCDVEIISELGVVDEWRKFCELHQISYCYLAKVVGEKRDPEFTEDEIAEGFIPVWLSYDKALEMLEKLKSDKIEAVGYMVPRDVAILMEAKKYL